MQRQETEKIKNRMEALGVGKWGDRSNEDVTEKSPMKSKKETL